jgi:hypothetical protein
MKCWGSSYFGQLGYGDTATRGTTSASMGDNLPAVSLGGDATWIAVRGNMTCATVLANQATGLKCWGLNAELGQPTYIPTSPIGDQPSEVPANLSAINLGSNLTVRSVNPTGSSVCAWLDDGSLKCWGLNSYGELGLGDATTHGDVASEMGDGLPRVPIN